MRLLWTIRNTEEEPSLNRISRVRGSNLFTSHILNVTLPWTICIDMYWYLRDIWTPGAREHGGSLQSLFWMRGIRKEDAQQWQRSNLRNAILAHWIIFELWTSVVFLELQVVLQFVVIFSYCCFCMSLLSSLAWGQKGRSTGWWEIVHLHLWFWFEETDGFLKVCRDLCAWYFYFASVGCQCKTSIELGCSFCFCAAEQSTSKVQAVFVVVVTFSLPPVDPVASQRALAGGLWCTGCKEIRQWRGQCDTFSMSGHDSLHDVMLYFSALFFLACISYVYSSPHRFIDI